MTIDGPSNECIWCDRRLVHSGYVVDCNEGFGPRPRSEEHIIPKDVFGRLTTMYLCKCCNEFFGSVCDHSLVKDPRIFEAARRAGISEKKLWSEYKLVRATADGRQVMTTYKKDKKSEEGSYQIQPKFKDLQQLFVGAMEGKISATHLKHLGHRLVEKVRRKSLGLSDKQIVDEVEKLLQQIRQSPREKHYNSIIDESFDSKPLPPQGEVIWQTRPWETDWCMAKISYELSKLLWPSIYCAYYAPVLARLRTFLTKREFSDDGKQGACIFTYDEALNERASKQHIIECVVTAFQVSWSLTFFGTARWSYSEKVTPVGPPPDPGYRIVVTNPFDDLKVDASFNITPVSCFDLKSLENRG